MSDPSCVFCKILAGEIPSTTVAESDRAVAFMDVNPATFGHLLVAPRTHAQDLLTADAEDVSAVALLAQRMAMLVTQRLDAKGVSLLQSNGTAAWQTVFHLHMHVIPRYQDDPLVLPWTPTPGDPQQIAAAADLLR